MKCGLGKQDLLQLEGGPKGIVLHNLKGTVWLTKGDGIDYLIHQGQSFQLAAGAKALVEALGCAEIWLEASACEGAGIRPIMAPDACRAAIC